MVNLRGGWVCATGLLRRPCCVVSLPYGRLSVILTMAKTKKSGKRPSVYLTKRRLASAARAGVREAAEETMKLMGHTIIAHEGWIVKKYEDGHIEKISRIEIVNTNGSLALD